MDFSILLLVLIDDSNKKWRITSPVKAETK